MHGELWALGTNLRNQRRGEHCAPSPPLCLQQSSQREICAKPSNRCRSFCWELRKPQRNAAEKGAETDRRKTNPNERRWKSSPGTPNPGAPMEPPALQGQPAPPRIPNPGNTALTPQECPHPTIPFPSSTRAAPQPLRGLLTPLSGPLTPLSAPPGPLQPLAGSSSPSGTPEGPSQSPT